MAYTVLMVDIRKSRQYQQRERQELQDFCLKTVELLNRIFADALVKNVEFSAGDELQGLFKRMDTAFLYLRLLRMLLWDKEVYAGIGHGDWTVQVGGYGTTFQDGPVYHLAREALEVCKKTRDYSVVILTTTEVEIIRSAMVNTLFKLNEHMTHYQNDLWFLLEIFWPVFDQGWGDGPNNLRDLLLLLKYKYTLLIFKDKIKNTQGFFSKNIVDTICNYHVQRYSKKGFLTEGHPYGAATQLVNVTGLHQQSIDKTLEKGNIFVERNTAFAIAAFLRKELKGEK